MLSDPVVVLGRYPLSSECSFKDITRIRIRGDLEVLLFSDGRQKITTHSQFLGGKERCRIYCNIQHMSQCNLQMYCLWVWVRTHPPVQWKLMPGDLRPDDRVLGRIKKSPIPLVYSPCELMSKTNSRGSVYGIFVSHLF